MCPSKVYKHFPKKQKDQTWKIYYKVTFGKDQNTLLFHKVLSYLPKDTMLSAASVSSEFHNAAIQSKTIQVKEKLIQNINGETQIKEDKIQHTMQLFGWPRNLAEEMLASNNWDVQSLVTQFIN